MIRKSLIDLLEVSRSVKVAYNAISYEVYDYEDGSYTEFRLQKVHGVDKLAKLTKGFDVNIYTSDGFVIVRIYENYSNY